MSDFYSTLTQEALEDNDSDSCGSGGDLNNILPDMDDLDANLFGLPAVKSVSKPTQSRVQASSSPLAIRKAPSSEHMSSTKFEKPASKSRLLAELFGDSDLHADDKPKSTVSFGRADTFDLSSPRPKTSPERVNEDSFVYRPTSEPRERRRQPITSTPAPADDLWSKFLQSGTPNEVTKQKDIPKADTMITSTPRVSPLKFTQEDKITEHSPIFDKSPQLSKSSSSPTKQPLSHSYVKTRETFEHPLINDDTSTLNDKIDAPKQEVSLSPEEILTKIKPFIEGMIAEQIEKEMKLKLSEDNSKYENFVKEIDDLKSLNQKLKKLYEKLEEKYNIQQERLEEVHELAKSERQELLQKLKAIEQEHKRELEEAHDGHRQKVAALEFSISALQRKLGEVQQQHLRYDDSMDEMQQSVNRLVTEQLSRGLSNFKSEVNNELQLSQAKLRNVESQLARLGAQLDEKWGEDDARLGSVEAKCRQLSSRKITSWEEDLEFRVDQTETNLATRLANTNKQQSRLAAWQEKQLADLSEYIDNRLWSLYNQLEVQRRELLNLSHRLLEQQAVMMEPCKETSNLRKVVNEHNTERRHEDERRDRKLSDLEYRMSNTQEETCKLSRLAERLCTILQMWEQRHKSATRIEADTLQSLHERYNMAIIEMGFSNTNK